MAKKISMTRPPRNNEDANTEYINEEWIKANCTQITPSNLPKEGDLVIAYSYGSTWGNIHGSWNYEVCTIVGIEGSGRKTKYFIIADASTYEVPYQYFRSHKQIKEACLGREEGSYIVNA